MTTSLHDDDEILEYSTNPDLIFEKWGNTIDAVIDGAGGINKINGGTLFLTGTGSNYAGDTIVSAGVVEFAANSSLGAGNVSLNGGTLRYGTGNIDDISGRNVTFDALGGTIDTNGNDVTFANGIGNTGPGAFTKAGGGTLTMSAANSYSGPTTISGGALKISANDQLGDPVTGSSLTLNGGKLLTTQSLALDSAGTSIRPVNIGTSGGTLDVADATTLTINGSVSGTGALTKTNTGTLAVNGNNSLSFSGPVNINGGSIRLGGTGQTALGTGTITFDGGTLRQNGFEASTTPGYGVLTNNLVVPAGKVGTLELAPRGNGGGGTTGTSVVSGTLTGSGTLNLVNNYVRDDLNWNASAFTGTINATSRLPGGADMRLQNANGFANAKLNLGAGVALKQTFSPGGAGAETVQNIGELSGVAGSFIGGSPNAGTFTNWTTGALNTSSTFSGNFFADTGGSRLTKVGTGTLTLAGTPGYTDSTAVNGGKLVTNIAIKNRAALSVSNDATLEVPINGGATGVTAVGSITMPTTATGFGGKVQLHDNDLVVDYGTGASSYENVLAMVKSGLPLLGFSGDGTGITSDEVIAQGAGGVGLNGTMLGVIDGATTGGQVTNLSGHDIVNPFTSVLVKYTWRGDANLDGVVNGSDYALADTGFSGGGTGWFYGDVNYDGVINGSDYALIDTGFSSQTGPLPEPAMLSLLGLGAMGMLRRRRRA
ncbi:MAG: autotransporter-associated beta strand repeat-containing protein [Burkholderiales bacterium]|nr:autotransporter-associated beta strand repeat-containing protein [Phycisphaerae bacterium]